MAPRSTTDASVFPSTSSLPDGGLTLLSLFSSTLLSTNRLNKLLHLLLTALVHPGNGLFSRAMLFLHNERTGSLQGMLGVTQELADGLHLIGHDPHNPLTGHWDLDDRAMAGQWQSDFCTAVRHMRIDLHEGCRIVADALHQRQLCHVEESCCLRCSDCNFIKRFKIRSFAAAPLISRNHNLGVLIVDNPDATVSASAEQLQLLQLFAGQAGMAIENTQLYNNLSEAHAELRDSRQRLVHSAHLAAVGEMAASISHELKTPLITIGGFAARLGRMLEPDTPHRHYLDTIISESHRLERMLADILAYSRKPTICYNRCNLREVVAECIDDYTTALSEHKIELQLALSQGDWPVLGDPNQLKQVFINLLVNAQEAMRQGGTLSITGDTTQLEGKPAVTISLADTGGGIPEDVLSKIFTPFFTTKRHGTGLGLAIVNRIIHNHGGILQAENNGIGARFVITLPLAEPLSTT